MTLLGKVDLAEHTKPTDQVKDGDHVLVFLFRPFLGGWSQTVGAFCTSGAAPGSAIAKLLLHCIVLLSNAGVVVDAVTCDNSTSNLSALNSLGVSGDTAIVSTSFEHPCDSSEVIQVIIDPPHIFKCIRNNLLKAGKFLLPGDKELQHFHFEALLDYEEQQAGIRAVPKLTKAHIRPNAFQKLSVKLAVQLFSESTASAMDFYQSREECVKLRGSKATSNFARRTNILFDCLNSKRPQDVQYNEAEHIATLKENIEWLDRWHTYNQSLRKQKQLFFLSKPTCNALRMTLHSTVTLVEKLLKCGFRYVLVGNFGQDHLEGFFGIARHVAGAGGQPTVQQFFFIYRLLSVNNLIRPPQRASVEGNGPRLLLKMQDLFQHKEPTVNQIDTLAVLFDDILLEPAECMQDMIHPESTRDCILDYLVGYVAKKFAKISCKDCLQTLRSNSREPTALTTIKTRGFLQVPSEQLLYLLQILEEHVEMRTIDNIACANVYMNIVENILLDDRTSSASVGCGTHFVSTTAEVVHFFIKCRLHFFTREQSKLFCAGGRTSCPARGERKPGA